MVLESGCCGKSLRTSILIIGMVFVAIHLVFFIQMVLRFEHFLQIVLEDYDIDSSSYFFYRKILLYAIMAFTLASDLFLIIYGLRKVDSRSLLVPWLIVVGSEVLAMLVLSIMGIIKLSVNGFSMRILLMGPMTFLFMTLLHLYPWVVIYSGFKGTTKKRQICSSRPGPPSFIHKFICHSFDKRRQYKKYIRAYTPTVFGKSWNFPRIKNSLDRW